MGRWREESTEETVSGTGCKVWCVLGKGCGRGFQGGVTWVWKW